MQYDDIDDIKTRLSILSTKISKAGLTELEKMTLKEDIDEINNIANSLKAGDTNNGIR